MTFGQARSAVTRLIFEYAERLDSGDLEGVAQLFERAGYGIEGAPQLRGADALLETMRRLVLVYADGTPRTKHVTTNLVIALAADGATATARSYFTVLQATDAFPLQTILAGRYADAFARDDSGWHFTSRILNIDLTGDTSRHLAEPIG